jgi:hypothetical protein
MSRITQNSEFSITPDSRPWARRYRACLALLAAFSFVVVPTGARAACGSFGTPSVKASIKLPAVAHADIDFPSPFANPTIVGLWHVIYTGADQSLFNDTFDTWHSDGTEFESAFLAPAGGDVCVGVWHPQDHGKVKLHHIGWLFNPDTPTATATNFFTLDEENTVARDGKSYSGTFTFKIWNLDGTAPSPQPIVKGTIAATRITVD